jgi:amino acid adenylation domain-containing protein
LQDGSASPLLDDPGGRGRDRVTNELVDCLSYWSERQPTAPAVEFEGESIPYQELDRSSSAIAATLRAQGVAPGDIVAIWMRKSIEAVVAIYATLKCAAAYVPIDPSAPLDRARRIIDDCDASCVVAHADCAGPLVDAHGDAARPYQIVSVGTRDLAAATGTTDWRQALLGDPATGMAADVDPLSPAYVLYTSGSTGAPKGVTLSHSGALAFIEWAVGEFDLRPTDRVSSHAPLHFDLSILDLFATSRAGGCVCLIPESQAGLGGALNAFVVNREISVWYSVPGAITRMLGATNSHALSDSRLRVVLFAGEVLPPKHLVRMRSLLPRLELYNLYGPTETNVCAFHRVGDLAVGAGNAEPIPIGRPCPYATTFLLDRHGTFLEHRPGQVGELCVAGESVMLGYWGDADLTDTKMVTISQQDAAPLNAYRTGDLVRVDADLNYVFCGREDDMVKVRGYRVELGDIESALAGADTVDEAACVAVRDASGETRIEAFVVPNEGRSDLQVIRRHCLSVLPRYMVPDTFHIVEALARTVNGKVDRRALGARNWNEEAGEDDADPDRDLAK